MAFIQTFSALWRKKCKVWWR